MASFIKWLFLWPFLLIKLLIVWTLKSLREGKMAQVVVAYIFLALALIVGVNSQKEELKMNTTNSNIGIDSNKTKFNRLSDSTILKSFYSLSESQIPNEITDNSDVIIYLAYLKVIQSNIDSGITRPTIANKCKKQRKVFSKHLSKVFPILRKRWAKNAETKLWRNNIYVSNFGSGYNILRLRNGIFANNANIEDTHKTLYELLYTLRFKKVQYLWYEGQEDFFYYNIKSPKDSELL